MAGEQDLTRTGTNAQKRKVCVLAIEGLTEADVIFGTNAGSIVAKLPDNSLLMSIGINLTTKCTTAGSSIDVLVGASVVANEALIGTTGALGYVDELDNLVRKFASGGDIIVKSGAVVPASGLLVFDLIIEYVELDLKTGEYTSMN